MSAIGPAGTPGSGVPPAATPPSPPATPSGGAPAAPLRDPILGSHTELQEVAAGRTTLGVGAQGEHVHTLQLALVRAAGSELVGFEGEYSQATFAARQRLDQEISAQRFGRATERELAGLQRRWGLPATGVLDAATLRKLDDVLNPPPDAVRRGMASEAHWRRLDGETVTGRVRDAATGQVVAGVDHAASARANLTSAVTNAVLALPVVGLVGASLGAAHDGDKKNWFVAIPGVGLLYALKDLGDAAVHGVALLLQNLRR